MEMHGYICGPSIYEFEGWLFEEAAYGGPWPLTKDEEPRKRAGKKFYEMWSRFDNLSPAQKRKCKVGGGCQRF